MRGVVRGALGIAVVSLPLWVTLSMAAHLNVDLLDFVPSLGVHDDLYYWRQIYTFSSVGFDGGYYTAEEVPARASFSHYYAHGPVFPALYGTLGRFFGWQLYSAPLFNLAGLTLALAGLLYGLRHDPKKMAALGLVIATAWPVFHFIVSNSQETLNQVVSIGLAVIFYRVLEQGPRMSFGTKLGFVAAIIGASLLRPTWAVLLVPFCLLCSGTRSRVSIGMASLLGLAAAAALFAATLLYLNAPYPYDTYSQLGEAITPAEGGSFASALAAAAALMARNTANNLRGTDEFLFNVQRFQIVGLVLVSVALVLRSWVGKRRKTGIALEPVRKRVLLFNVYQLIAMALIVTVLYDVSGDREYRVLFPHLLLGCVLLILNARYWLIALMSGIALIAFPAFVEYSARVLPHYFNHDPNRIAAFARATEGVIDYDPEAKTPWCNTLLFNFRTSYSPELTAIPAGIGTSFYLGPRWLRPPIKSQYLLGTERDFEILLSRVSLEAVARTSVGTLYVNRDADCDRPSKRPRAASPR